jgi:Na+/proline symporter
LVYKYFILKTSLDSVGLISFVVIAQLAPAFFGAIFWRRGSYKGAVIGLLADWNLLFRIDYSTILLLLQSGI